VVRFENFGVPLAYAVPTLGLTGDGRAEIFGGCNTYNGTYAVNGNGITIVVGPGTMMLCDEDVNAQESTYIRLLSQAAVYELPAGQLVLRNGAGAELLRFNHR
jgi:heat shock protein HslJ